MTVEDNDSGESVGVSEHSGFPNAATDHTLANLDLNSFLIKHPISTFLMRIRGRDWRTYGIFDTDLILIDRAPAPRSFDLVIWWQAESFIISRFKSVPKNREVWGVVTTIIHRF